MRRIICVLVACLVLVNSVPPVIIHATAGDVGWLLAQINCLRQSVGAGPLTLNGALNTSATIHSVYLSTSRGISNYHTQADGSTPQSRATAAGYSGYVGENVVAGSTAAQAFSWWRGDDIHYRNMTNVYWTDVGVGIASGSNGTWYTLDFGTHSWTGNRVTAASCGSNIIPTSQPQSNSAASDRSSATRSSTGNSSISKPPAVADSFDAQGNIKHQVQAGETLGHIALLYGYTWADIPNFLALNHMTETDFRKLKIGSIFLVPPKSGTFTPAPNTTNSPNTITPTAIATTATAVLTASNTPNDSSTPTGTPTDAPALTVTASPVQSPLAKQLTLPPTTIPVVAVTIVLTTISQISTIAPTFVELLPPVADSPPDPSNTPADNPLRHFLPWAIVAQGLILGGVFLRFIWRQR